MNPIELLISLIAPHVCIFCRREGAPACLSCMSSDITKPTPYCCLCGCTVLGASFLCDSCAVATRLSGIFPSASYAGLAKDLTKQLKFQRVKAAASVMAYWISMDLPPPSQNALICPIPTASQRVRARGYDQASLIAKSLARELSVPQKQVLRRVTNTRQVGASRASRIQQMENAYSVHHEKLIQGRDIMLIDDVLTTGATIKAAAAAILPYSPKSISAVVFACKPTEGTFPSSTRIDSG